MFMAGMRWSRRVSEHHLILQCRHYCYCHFPCRRPQQVRLPQRPPQQQQPHQIRRCASNHHHHGSGSRITGRDDGNGGRPNILFRPTLFTGAVCLGSFGAVAIWNQELVWQEEQKRQQKQSIWENLRSSLFQKSRNNNNNNKTNDKKGNNQLFQIPIILRQYLNNDLALACEDIMNDNSGVGPIVLVTTGLHMLFWILPGLKWRYFVHDPTSGRAVSLLLSTFAHSGIFHLGMNMYVLWNFGPPVAQALSSSSHTKSDDACLAHKQQFWAAYASAGTVASWGSMVLGKVMNTIAGVPMRPGLGASGAIFAVVSSFCLLHPDQLVRIVPLPWMPSLDVLKGVVAMDVAGLCAGIVYETGLGHAAHLSGTMAGYFLFHEDGLSMVEGYQARVAKLYRTMKYKISVFLQEKD